MLLYALPKCSQMRMLWLREVYQGSSLLSAGQNSPLKQTKNPNKTKKPHTQKAWVFLGKPAQSFTQLYVTQWTQNL